MFDYLARLIEQNETLLWALTLGTLGFFVLSLLSLPLLIRLIPTHLLESLEHGKVPPPEPSHPGWLILRNLLGGLLVLGGLAMLVLPGQGLLTLAAGLLLMSFPGKRALMEKALERPAVHRWLHHHLEKRRARQQMPSGEAVTE